MHSTKAHERAIKAHCEKHRIRMETLPSGAIRFLGRGVNITVAEIGSVTLENLTEYQPQKGYAMQNAWPELEYK